MSLRVAQTPVRSDSAEPVYFGHLPPAYHDEYSYRLQSETFLAGRTWFASFEPHPELFDQMHVLNEGRMASRYFPAVGWWLLPGTAIDSPLLMQHLAHGLAAWLLFWIGCELSCLGVGLLAGLLFALSPGVLLFSNLLLAHHPTLVGLHLCLWGWLRMQRTLSVPWAIVAGTGLAFAMLCRPMTAAGFALPLGLATAWSMINSFTRSRSTAQAGQDPQAVEREMDSLPKPSSNRSLQLAMGLAIPIVFGLLIQAWYNSQITGNWRITPYQQYTELYTPRHVYGFNNVVRGELQLGPKVLDQYDRWAENLTPTLAMQNVVSRLIHSGEWTLGLIPSGVVLLGLLLGSGWSVRWSLVLASIVSLHLVHIPYWFVGIMHWHYVFETAPLWLLLVGQGCRGWLRPCKETGCPWQTGCVIAVLVTALLVNLYTVPPLWASTLDRGIAEVAWPRLRYHEFEQRVEALREGNPALVLVLPDPFDISMDYVTNHAGLQGDVLRARWRPELVPLDEIRRLFPSRRVILFDAAAREYAMPRPETAEPGRASQP